MSVTRSTVKFAPLWTTVLEIHAIFVHQTLKGNSGLSTSWAEMEEHEKCKRISHY